MEDILKSNRESLKKEVISLIEKDWTIEEIELFKNEVNLIDGIVNDKVIKAKILTDNKDLFTDNELQEYNYLIWQDNIKLI